MPKAAKKKITKTAFVLGLPSDMPAKEVVSKAKEAGITISDGYVYEIRSATKRKAQKDRSTAKGKPGPKPKAARAPADGPALATLSRLVVEHGVGRVREMLNEIEQRVERMLAGR